MAKITSFMRVTKTPTAAEGDAKHKKVTSSPFRAPSPPAAKTKRAASAPTPPVDDENELVDVDGGHVPEFIYKASGTMQVVKYARRGEGERVSKELLTITHYEVPADFERNHRFGPHSGLTFEKRLVRAYLLQLLEPKGPVRKRQAPEIICITCAKLGHSHRECPDGF
ncbi:hypothetical protein PybrP1_006911 [[Pythium] brassicae (nom. inval.)]|nr:hypothetical protein PybrP1_006911 [[Pythium] brassicae (nom. inval.)]